MSIADMITHVRQLAARINCRIEPIDACVCGARHEHDAESDPLHRIAKLPDVSNHRTYAIALHELGHVAVGVLPFNWQMRVAGEILAWAWAKENALDWSEHMTAAMQESLDTYLKRKPCNHKHGSHKH